MLQEIDFMPGKFPLNYFLSILQFDIFFMFLVFCFLFSLILNSKMMYALRRIAFLQQYKKSQKKIFCFQDLRALNIN